MTFGTTAPVARTFTRMMNKEENRANFFPRQNNLEWLRLIFALQVVLSHTTSHLESGLSLPSFISNFPGVPAFFFVSGFLIYSSYINSAGMRYFENRFLRLFPGLVVVTLGGGGVVLLALGFDILRDNYSTFIFWFVAQITIGQAYNPELFRSVGIGVINGSLWTITTEIIFYLIVPLLVWMEKRARCVLVALIAISFLIYATGPQLLNGIAYRNKTFFDLLSLTPIVWGWMFGMGIATAKYYSTINFSLKYLIIFLIPLVIMIFFGDGVFFSPSGNRLGFFYFICFAALIVWGAFWLPVIKLPFDFSYGAYIWHIPIVNLLLVLNIHSMPVAIALTLCVAALSWFLIEKPMLRLKRQSLRPV